MFQERKQCEQKYECVRSGISRIYVYCRDGKKTGGEERQEDLMICLERQTRAALKQLPILLFSFN